VNLDSNDEKVPTEDTSHLEENDLTSDIPFNFAPPKTTSNFDADEITQISHSRNNKIAESNNSESFQNIILRKVNSQGELNLFQSLNLFLILKKTFFRKRYRIDTS
jgi:hypothetical protein